MFFSGITTKLYIIEIINTLHSKVIRTYIYVHTIHAKYTQKVEIFVIMLKDCDGNTTATQKCILLL